MEIWKEIPGYPKYTISTFGNIKNNKNKIIKHQNNINAFTVILVGINGRKTLLVHRLLGLTFIPNPENKPFVIHIDNNSLNNDIDNLMWATSSEMNLNRKPFKFKGIATEKLDENFIVIKEYISCLNAAKEMQVNIHTILDHCKTGKLLHGFYFRVKPQKTIKGEIWKEITLESTFSVSNKGRIKNSKGIFSGTKGNGGYYTVNSGTKTYKVHRLIYSVFKNVSLNEMKNLVINHIDEHKSNNDIDNLELVTQAENVMHSSIHNYKKLYQINPENGEIVNKFDSIVDASNKLNLKYNGICRACKIGSVFSGFKWELKISN